ncbi:hypothetical protein [Ferribacterium limneticum]|uniref:hypothetical protein n=1 Tax=Ferribacterium limneticum TaxID=76259 RepID=UPI001CF9597E|nr:hypothetical protein [Ferribacterium limneticum]UCV27855.1 hypothetical protein KI617_16645 [Ferribacterium limneticum]UCV31772.1 hypothetical protein KI608_16645 [Ferribacterium limneticum]
MRLTPLLFILLAAIPAAHAARPMITDDARLTDAGACQVESWVHLHGKQRELWTLPACNPGGNFELTLGGALAYTNSHQDSGATVIQGKTLFKPLETNGYGIGLAAGYSTQPGNSHSGNPYFYVPVSFSLADDRLVIHTNLGYTRERENKENRLTWGLGSETQLAAQTWLIAESYGQDKGNPFFQVGIRHWIVPNHVQIDTTYGSQFGHVSEQHWFSIGLRLISPKLF